MNDRGIFMFMYLKSIFTKTRRDDIEDIVGVIVLFLGVYAFLALAPSV